jgi:hypothetical protein
MTYLTRTVAFLITVFLGLFSVVGTPTWKRFGALLHGQPGDAQRGGDKSGQVRNDFFE